MGCKGQSSTSSTEIITTQDQAISQQNTFDPSESWKEKYLSVIVDLGENDLDGFGFEIALCDINGDGIPELFYRFLGEAEGYESLDMYYLKNEKIEKEELSEGGLLLNDKTGETAFYKYQYGHIKYFCQLPCAYKLSLDQNGIVYTPVYTYEPMPGHEKLMFGYSTGKTYPKPGFISLDIIKNIGNDAYDEIYWNDELYPEMLKLLEDKMNFFFYNNNEEIFLKAEQYDNDSTAYLNSLKKVELDWLDCFNENANDSIQAKEEFKTFVLMYLENSL